MFRNHWKTCLRWTLLIGTLVGLGTVIYLLESPEPLWETVRGPKDEFLGNQMWTLGVFFTPNGQSVVTFPARIRELGYFDKEKNEILAPDSVTIWNRITGERLARYPKANGFSNLPARPRDFRRCVGAFCIAPAKNENDRDIFAISLADLTERRETIIPLKLPPGRMPSDFAFSPKADIFVCLERDRDEADASGTLHIHDAATGAALEGRPSVMVRGFTADYLVHIADRKPTCEAIELWSLSQRKVAMVLRKEGWALASVSRGGRSLVMFRIPKEGERITDYALWDLASQEFKINPTAWLHGVCDLESPDGRWAADHSKTIGISLWERAAEKKRGSSELSAVYDYSSFSPDSRFLIWPRREFYPEFDLSNIGPPPPGSIKFHGLTAFAVPSMDVAWQAAWGESVTKIAFSPDSQTLFAAFETERDVLLFDTPTGNPRGRIGMPCTGATTLTSTPDLRCILVHRLDDKKPPPAAANFVEQAIAWLLSIVQTERRSHDTVVVRDAESNAERFRLTGRECDRAWLSDDGSMLITTHTEDNCCVMRCWNVGRKPLRWVIGVPAAIGLIAFGFARWRNRKR